MPTRPPQTPREEPRSRRLTFVTLAALLLVALNLRLSLAGVGPVLDQVRGDLDFSRSVGGLLTTVPLVCFGLLAPASAYLGGWWSNESVLLAALAVLVAGIVLRSLAGLSTLLLGTVLLGAGIAVGNVLVPVLVKQHLAGVAGTAMALYTAFLTGGAALGAAGTAGLAAAGWHWRAALAVDAVPAGLAVAAFGLWWAAHRRRRSAVAPPPAGVAGRVWRSPMAWQLAGYMGGQSLLFYSVLTWLPVLLQDRGVSLAESGLMLSLFSILGIVGALAVPPLATRGSDQRLLAVLSVAGWIVGVGGLWWAPGWYGLWAAELGVTQGAGIAMSLTLIVIRARTSAAARHLSGMVQMTGYLIAAVGPALLGALRDHTGGWDAPLGALLAVGVLLIVAGFGIGRGVTIG